MDTVSTNYLEIDEGPLLSADFVPRYHEEADKHRRGYRCLHTHVGKNDGYKDTESKGDGMKCWKIVLSISFESSVTMKDKSARDGRDLEVDVETCAAQPQGESDLKMQTEAREMQATVGVDVDYGYISRSLNGRHMQLIALSGSIGTGLFVGIGRALTQGGPLSLLLGYSVTGIAVYGMMQSLGEMTTWLPLPGAIPQFCGRYVDEALGFVVGWNAWYSSAIILCVEISAASLVIDYWSGAESINVAVWISIFIVFIFCLNIIAVRIFGEAETVFGIIKITTLIGLLILSLIIDLGGVKSQPRLGFHYWKDPGPMNTYKAAGGLGRFLGLWSTLSNAAFSYNGVEMIAAIGGEVQNPRRNIPRAIKTFVWRILFFYILGSLALGVLVPYNEPNLLQAQASDASGAAQSPWVIAINRAHIAVLPSIINAVILTSAASSANALLYTGSRYLYALAQAHQAPLFMLRCTKSGVPYYAVAITGSISALTYLSCGESAETSFVWFQNIAALSGLFTWCSILVAYLRFYAALKAQNIDRDTLHFKGPFQPYLATISLVFFSLVIVFNGFYTFMPWDANDFVTAYVGVPIFVVLFCGWKIFKRTKLIPSAEVDLHTGKQALDAMEDSWPTHHSQSWWRRLIF